MEEDQELQNPFPSPPSHYVNYTSHNIHLFSLLKARLEEENENIANVHVKKQQELLLDEKDVPDWPLTQLEKPRVDWIIEEGEYTVFGETWPISERIASLGQIGGTQLYPEDPTVDRRPALQSVLQTLLYTYSNFLSAIIAPPVPPNEPVQPDWERLLEWMRVMGQNIIGAANDLRPVQARANLETMMVRQLELRREEAKVIHATCDTLEVKLSELQQQLKSFISVTSDSKPKESPLTPGQKIQKTDMDVDPLFVSGLGIKDLNDSEDAIDADLDRLLISEVTQEDMFRWAEEVRDQE